MCTSNRQVNVPIGIGSSPSSGLLKSPLEANARECKGATKMKNRILTLAGILALVAVLGKFYAVPAIAQAVRAAVVKNIDEPGRSPFQQEAFFSGSCPNITACSVNYAPVPANKRLVITNVSGRFLTTG